MESNQLNNPNEDAVIEALTLKCEVNKYGAKTYLNKEGKFHRIHGPAVIWSNGAEYWYKNGKYHREDGPAAVWYIGPAEYYINGNILTKEEFIQWQKDNGIKPIK